MNGLVEVRRMCVLLGVAAVSFIVAVDGTFSFSAWAQALRP